LTYIEPDQCLGSAAQRHYLHFGTALHMKLCPLQKRLGEVYQDESGGPSACMLYGLKVFRSFGCQWLCRVALTVVGCSVLSDAKDLVEVACHSAGTSTRVML
jgi:hypothetical protein